MTIISSFDYFVAVAKTIVQERRSRGPSGRKDLVQLMIDAHDGSTADAVKLTDDEIAAQALTFLLAGFKSTANTLASAAYFLAVNPEAQEKLICEMDLAHSNSPTAATHELVNSVGYLDQVLSEVLRLCPPNFNILRECKTSCVIDGVSFPAGVDVNIPVYAIQRDPQAFPDPVEFNPDNFSAEAKSARHAYSFTPFGMGPRQCIGFRFAMMEMKLSLGRVLQRFRFQATPETVARLEHRAMITMAPRDPLYLKIVRR